ncbi:Dolichyl-phosphate-mannose--protein mannosyltransferase 1 [Fusarium oxysporum f. sp. albedinis]|nr:Dolichyl-phosphate-mannose--protein mannosyltransferase 1 [Fusarium oxysporum f. sp. albedinis]
MMFISNHLGEPAMYSVCERLYLPVTSASRGAINVRRPGRNGTRRVLGGARDGISCGWGRHQSLGRTVSACVGTKCPNSQARLSVNHH